MVFVNRRQFCYPPFECFDLHLIGSFINTITYVLLNFKFHKWCGFIKWHLQENLNLYFISFLHQLHQQPLWMAKSSESIWHRWSMLISSFIWMAHSSKKRLTWSVNALQQTANGVNAWCLTYIPPHPTRLTHIPKEEKECQYHQGFIKWQTEIMKMNINLQFAEKDDLPNATPNFRHPEACRKRCITWNPATKCHHPHWRRS